LAEFEKVLQEMGSQPKLIEIETRFVEVAQEDLNSLGFEWILNSDYSLNLGNKLGKALGIKEGVFPGAVRTEAYTKYDNELGTRQNWAADNIITPGEPTSGAKFSDATRYKWDDGLGGDGAQPIASGKRNIGINAFGGSSDQQNGNRYLSTVGNHVSGEGASHNDQFMRVNAFLGSADLSMILHMLSQRSDTDLLSAPKVVTKSGENAVIKVVTEYIYPQDYDVQLQSSSSSSGSNSSGGSSQSAILAVVEPQNFTMREVGVILDVTPTYSEANGGMIDLELKPQVVDEPTWKNYGMQIPFTGNAANNNLQGVGDILGAAVDALVGIGAELDKDMKQLFTQRIVDSATTSLENISKSSKDNMTWYDAPMEQPFFHVRSIDSKVSISPGATVVMGGLITEQRKAMDDKVPFLGDIPFIGRLFRSHAEWTNKRNLLIFVTGRLITPAGRELPTNSVEEQGEGEVKAAPVAK
jgi:general secretion pathway protein D